MLRLPALLLLALPLAAQQLEIIEAAYGAGNFQMNLAQKLRGMIQNDVLDIAVDPAVLGGDPAPGSAKRLRVVYRYGGRQFEISAGDFERIRIPGTAATPISTPSPPPGGGFSLGDLWGAGSLRIVSARYGEGTRFTDVRERLQNLVRNDVLSLTVDNAAMGGDPAPARNKMLEVTYEYRGVSQQATVKEGASLVLPTTAAAPVTDALTPKVLRIASARYGGDNRYNDVRDRLQGLVRDNTLSVKADNAVLGGDPAVGKDKVLEVTYEWSGAIYAASAKEGRTLNLPEAGAKPILNVVTPQPAQPSGRTADSDASRTAGNRSSVGGPTTSPSAGREITPIGRAGGLRIFYARYGVTGREIDVRERLRPLLQNDVLNAVVGVDSMGADPAVGTPKTLTVIYEFRGRTLEKAVADGQALVLP